MTRGEGAAVATGATGVVTTLSSCSDPSDSRDAAALGAAGGRTSSGRPCRRADRADLDRVRPDAARSAASALVLEAAADDEDGDARLLLDSRGEASGDVDAELGSTAGLLTSCVPRDGGIAVFDACIEENALILPLGGSES